jgi:hypothetical protein
MAWLDSDHAQDVVEIFICDRGLIDFSILHHNLGVKRNPTVSAYKISMVSQEFAVMTIDNYH